MKILAARSAECRDRLEKMVKKAKKYNVDFSFEIGAEYGEEEKYRTATGAKRTRTVMYCDVTWSGETPVVGPYEFMASIEITPAGNLVDVKPGAEVDPMYRTTDCRCEHCNVNRTRKHVFVVRHKETGKMIQVGRTCLRDFLGTDNPEWIVGAFKFFRELEGLDDDETWGFGGSYWAEPVEQVLAITSAIIRLHGWCSVGASRGDENAVPTVSYYWDTHALPSSKLAYQSGQEIKAELRDSDYETAQEVIAWARGQENVQSDYLWNLKVLMSEDMVYDPKRVGLLVSAVASYTKAEDRKKEKAKEVAKAADSKWIGDVGERLRGLEVEVIGGRSMGDRGYGETILYKFRAGDDLLCWFTSPRRFDKGDKLVLDFTVKAHNEFNGAKETQITRAKVHEVAEVA